MNFLLRHLPQSIESIDSWFTLRRFAVVLSLLFVALFPDVIFGTQTFFLRDFGSFGYPLAYYHRECFWRGEIPLWNPLSMCGLPFLAQWNTLVCYPGSLFYLIFPLSWSLGVFCILHLILGGIGMYSLARYWTGSSFGAAVAGLMFAFNGLSLNCLMWPATSAGYGWIPWVILFTERGMREGGRTTLLAILAGTMQMLTGMPEFILLTWVIVAGMGLGFFIYQSVQRTALIRRFLGIVVMISALCAIQLLPFFQLVSVGNREEEYQLADSWSMPSLGWGNFLVPLFGCFRIPLGVYFQDDQFWTSSYYAGIGTVLLALVALRRCASRRTIFLAVIALGGLLFGLGNDGYVYSFMRKVFPAVGYVRYPVKFVMLTVFALPLLAAYASAHYLHAPPQKCSRRLELVIASVMALAMVGMVWFSRNYPMLDEEFSVTLKNAVSRAAFLALIIALAIFVQRSTGVRQRWALCVGLLGVLWLDVITHAPTQNPRVVRSVYEPGLAQRELKFSPEPRHGESRVMIHPYANMRASTETGNNPLEQCMRNRLALFCNHNLLEHWPSAMAFYPVVPKYIHVLIRGIYLPDKTSRRPLLDFMNVRYITEPGHLAKWQQRPGYMPFATLGQKPVFVDEKTHRETVLGAKFDPGRSVYIDKSHEAALGPMKMANAGALETRAERERSLVVVRADRPALVIVSQTWFPAWKAYVNGQPAPVLRANYAFQAVPVPPGESRVEFRYEDRYFRVGAIITGFSFLVFVVAWRRLR